MDALNATSAAALVATVPTWSRAFDIIQLVLSVLGAVANAMTLVTLMVNGDGFSDIICLLLRVQAVLDGIVCMFAGLLYNLPSFWRLGITVLDKIICQVWHGQYAYWAAVLSSIWNLVMLAVERYICVCHPMKYILLTKSKVRMLVLIALLIGCICSAGAIFQARMRNDRCEAGMYWEGPALERFFYGYVIFIFFCHLAIPSTLFSIFYGFVIMQFRKRAKSSLGASGSSSVVDKASAELTKTAVVVTVIFVVSYSVVIWHFLLGYTGVTEYKVNTPLQRVGGLMALMNSVANPFVYASFMPVYRRSVQQTFSFSCCRMPR